jgi:peptidoglycan/LPS O-acetylase OafA/YrhL
MNYRKEIDGLRAVAILPVLLYHASLGIFPGGFIGVDVFFVISGYLIASLIFEEVNQKKFSLINFYERRARRILPALFVVMLVTLITGWIYMDPFELKELSQSAFATSLFSSNIYFTLKVGYFDISSDLKPLLHTWSLAVEEQYYFIFPLLVMLIWKTGIKSVAITFALISVLSFILAITLNTSLPSSSFFLLHTRAWELLIGALVALYFHSNHVKKIPEKIANYASMIGFIMILTALFLIDGSMAYPGNSTLLPVIGTGLVILCTNKQTIVYKILSQRMFIFTGLISYSLYLWHQPILAFARIITLEELTTPIVLISLALTFVLAIATKRYVEDPFRKKSVLASRASLLSSTVLVSFLFIAFGIAGHLNNGFPERNELSLRLAQNYGLSAKCSGAPLDEAACVTSADPKAFIWGDSFAMHLASAINTYEQEGVKQLTMSGCPPIVGYDYASRKTLVTCYDYNQSVINYLESLENVKNKRVYLSLSTPLKDSKNLNLFSTTLQRLKSKGFNVIVISPTPVNAKTLNCIKRQARHDGLFSDCQFDISDISNQNLFSKLSMISTQQKVSLVDLRDFICDKKSCGVSKADTILYRDNGHLSNESSIMLADFLRTELN